MSNGKKEELCNYCDQPTGEVKVTKVVVGVKHTFCSELCWALFRYDYPKEKIWLEWS